MRLFLSGGDAAHTRRARLAWLAEAVSALYIGVIALIAQATGLFYVLFPELGALGHDILKRPRGTWARAPLLLVVTPFLTALGGTVIARHLPYGMLAVLLSVGYSVLIIGALSSPIAPAISAGLLPLCLSIRSWWYPPSLLIGTGLLAGIAALRNKIERVTKPVIAEPHDLADDIVEEAPADYSWVPFFVAFLLVTIAASAITGWRLVLFPPLVVIAFEAFAHSSVCPWAGRPIALTVACGLTALAGVLCAMYLGTGPIGAMCSMMAGIVVLRLLDLHVPPALAVGLLPFVIRQPDFQFPLAVTLGTALQAGALLAWRRIALPRRIGAG
ncbi:MAG: HPP family protein [Gammaproteobacteria bacterium]|nr:HPP family protein [Gammaproteobacteria bacterium]